MWPHSCWSNGHTHVESARYTNGIESKSEENYVKRQGICIIVEPQKTTINSFPKPDEAVNGWSLNCAKLRDFACVVFGLSGFPSRKENGLLSSRAPRERNRTIERSS